MIVPGSTSAAIMAYLAEHPEGLCADEAMSAIGTDGGHVSSNCGELVRRGLLDKIPEPKGRGVRRLRYFLKGKAPAVSLVLPSTKPQKSKLALRLDRSAPTLPHKVKPTICQSGKDHRFTPATVEPFFQKTLGIGRYMGSTKCPT